MLIQEGFLQNLNSRSFGEISLFWTLSNNKVHPIFSWMYYDNNDFLNSHHSLYTIQFLAPVRCLEGNYDFQWSDGSTNSNLDFIATNSQTYYLTVNDGVGTCTDSIRLM